jgi:protein-S-isoprenylcysteine O-methyltransferase Ste14
MHWSQLYLALAVIIASMNFAFVSLRVRGVIGRLPVSTPAEPVARARSVLLIFCLVAEGVVAAAYVLNPATWLWFLPFTTLAVGTMQVVGAICVGVALVVGVVAAASLGRSWNVNVATGNRVELVTHGIFGRVRHPYFASLDLLAVGVLLMLPNITTFILFVVIAVLLHLQIFDEEEILAEQHGDAYHDYLNRTWRYLPRIGPPDDEDSN